MAPANRLTVSIDQGGRGSIPESSNRKGDGRLHPEKDPTESFATRCCNFIYNRQEKSFCGRTALSWLYIIIYSIVYFCFLFTYSCMLLYGSLWIIRATIDFSATKPVVQLMTNSEYGVGLSATPSSESGQPLIWYRKDHEEDYQEYINALNNLVVKKRRKRDVSKLGPCGESPYGYGKKPCVIIRINKQLHWAGKPLELNSTVAKTAPLEVQNWLKKDKMLWLHCGGYHSYDREHIGRILYYPDPPGFDPKLFPLSIESESPLVAMQISDFTIGVSLAVECKLWYANGPSSVEFMFYVAPDDRTVSNRSNV